ncbi:MAG: hypothetical protein LBE56_12375 [Tannerella sp.]|jgi:hypothetical protein|nr:hypothetical protein [Tannerella sp.]
MKKIFKTLKLWILMLLGYRFIGNRGTMEIHRIDSRLPNCRLPMIVNREYIHVLSLRKYLRKGWNGCRFCMKRFDTG